MTPIIKFIWVPVVATTLVSGLTGQDIRMRVVDETGIPVQGAVAVISYNMVTRDDHHEGPTDPEGRFSAQGQGLMRTFLSARKEGHYPAELTLPPNQDTDQLIVLPRILKPKALYALGYYDGGGNRLLKFPATDQWFGYDFEAGDWVQPNGSGKTVDIRFQLKRSFRGYLDGLKNLDDEIASSKRAFAARNEEWTEEKIKMRAGKWDAQLDVSFPGEKEGMHEEKERFLPYSQMKLPHEAPADGYVATWRYVINNYSPTTIRDDIGFFLRTRVKLDGNGRILSANYTKIIGDFRPDVQGGLEFKFYFNPVPNDRNLEFDPKKNLFPANLPGANVGTP